MKPSNPFVFFYFAYLTPSVLNVCEPSTGTRIGAGGSMERRGAGGAARQRRRRPSLRSGGGGASLWAKAANGIVESLCGLFCIGLYLDALDHLGEGGRGRGVFVFSSLFGNC